MEDDDQDNGLKSCTCGTELEKNEPKCSSCGRLQNMIDEDIVEPVVVKDDESAAWLDTDLFPDEKCSCNKSEDELCEHCQSLMDTGQKAKDVSIQADLSFDPSSVLENSMHVCEGESCVCCDADDALPLDKSVQVSDFLLDQAGSVIDSDIIKPISESNLQSGKDVINCPDCGNPIHDSEGADICRKCKENQTDIIPPSPFQDNKLENDLQRTSNPDLKSSFPDFLDETSNYTDRETDVQTRVTDATAADTDSLANAARVRQGNRNETTEVI